MTNPSDEHLLVRLDFHSESSHFQRDSDHTYLFVKLDELVNETSAICAYKVLTDEDKTDSNAMDIIARTLSGSEWNADMVEAIVDLVRATGRKIEDLSELSDD